MLCAVWLAVPDRRFHLIFSFVRREARGDLVELKLASLIVPHMGPRLSLTAAVGTGLSSVPFSPADSRLSPHRRHCLTQQAALHGLALYQVSGLMTWAESFSVGAALGTVSGLRSIPDPCPLNARSTPCRETTVSPGGSHSSENLEQPVFPKYLVSGKHVCFLQEQ